MTKDKHMICVEHFEDENGDRIAEIWHEPYTDVLYMKEAGNGSGFTVMLDPESGLPLTFYKWIMKYHE